MEEGTVRHHSIFEQEGAKRLIIHLEYTPEIPTSSPNSFLLNRVHKVRQYLNLLPARYSSTKHQQTQTAPRKKPERKPTFDFYEPDSEEDTNLEEQASAKMSSEKASNAKDKLEGTYQGRG